MMHLCGHNHDLSGSDPIRDGIDETFIPIAGDAADAEALHHHRVVGVLQPAKDIRFKPRYQLQRKYPVIQPVIKYRASFAGLKLYVCLLYTSKHPCRK